MGKALTFLCRGFFRFFIIGAFLHLRKLGGMG